MRRSLGHRVAAHNLDALIAPQPPRQIAQARKADSDSDAITITLHYWEGFGMREAIRPVWMIILQVIVRLPEIKNLFQPWRCHLSIAAVDTPIFLNPRLVTTDQKLVETVQALI